MEGEEGGGSGVGWEVYEVAEGEEEVGKGWKGERHVQTI
jgi:hypothetical protein